MYNNTVRFKGEHNKHYKYKQGWIASMPMKGFGGQIKEKWIH